MTSEFYAVEFFNEIIIRYVACQLYVFNYLPILPPLSVQDGTLLSMGMSLAITPLY